MILKKYNDGHYEYEGHMRKVKGSFPLRKCCKCNTIHKEIAMCHTNEKDYTCYRCAKIT